MLSIVGINHNCKNLELQEQVALAGSSLNIAYENLINTINPTEAMILSTCGRTECVATIPVEKLKKWYITYFQLNPNTSLYTLTGTQALEHLLKLNCGLDSKIVGEPQILGQTKRAFELAQQLQLIGPTLGFWIPSIRKLAKDIRNNLGINICPMSLPSMIKKTTNINSNPANMVIVGTGTVGQQVLQFFQQTNLFKLTIVNRNPNKSKTIANNLNIAHASISQLPQILTTTDILITATSSAQAIITKTMLQKIQNNRNFKPIDIFDLSMPKNVATDCSQVHGVNLYSLNYLSNLIASQHQLQNHLIVQSNLEIKQQIQQQLQIYNSKNSQDILIEFRQNVANIQQQINQWGARELAKGNAADLVLKQCLRKFARTITHGPTTTLRQIIQSGQKEQLHNINLLLNQVKYKNDKETQK